MGKKVQYTKDIERIKKERELDEKLKRLDKILNKK